MKELDLIIKQAEKTMGFTPNSLRAMGRKPNVLGAFSMLFANIKGFSSAKISPWTALKVQFRNMRWMIQAKKESHLEVPGYLKDLIAHVASNAAGCRYCQAHTAHSAHRSGVEVEKLQAVWDFENSELFSPPEKAALAFALAAGSTPNMVTAAHHERLKKHFSEKQIVEIVGTISIFGFLNRWNDSMATELEPEPLKFAQEHLSAKWEAGKHVRA